MLWFLYCKEEWIMMFNLPQVDLRHRQISKSVEDVYKIIKDLTAEVSSKDARFQSIANSEVHHNGLKVNKCMFGIVNLLHGLSFISLCTYFVIWKLYSPQTFFFLWTLMILNIVYDLHDNISNIITVTVDIFPII